MVSYPDDFTPIVERGEIEEVKGRFGRRRRPDLPTLETGLQRVILDDSDRLGPREKMSAGERFFAGGGAWVNVDVRDHTLEYRVGFEDPDTSRGFVVTVTVRATVSNPVEVARKNIENVKDYLEPALRGAIGRTVTIAAPKNETSPRQALSNARESVHRSVSALVAREVENLPPWLGASITTVEVGFDQSTREHYDTLVSQDRGDELFVVETKSRRNVDNEQHVDALAARRREGELIDAGAKNNKKLAKHALDIQDIWRAGLKDVLDDPAQRRFAALYADPSPANITRVVAELEAGDRERRREVVDILQALIDKDYLDRDDPMYRAIEEVVMRLPGITLALDGAAPPRLGATAEADGDHEAPAESDDVQDAHAEEMDDEDWGEQA